MSYPRFARTHPETPAVPHIGALAFLCFWNPKIDCKLKASDYPNQSSIESAKYRYTIALGKLVPHPNFPPCNKKSAPYRQMIIESRSSEKKRFDKLLEKVEECLSPYDKVFEVLLGEFTSPFAQQVLFTYQNLIGEFAGKTLDNYQSWTELLVCMSHKDFWTDLASGKAGDTKERLDMSLMTPEARVLAVYADMPDLTMTAIAKKAEVNRTSLYRMEKFMAVRKMRKAEEASSYKDAKPTGEKDGETGEIEACKK